MFGNLVTGYSVLAPAGMLIELISASPSIPPASGHIWRAGADHGDFDAALRSSKKLKREGFFIG